jgi:NAD(P)H-hydrate epimerase
MTAFPTCAQMRELDRRAIEEFGVPGVVLMENAGRGAAELLLGLGCRGPVLILCGKGNNGGDGFVIARHLENRGIRVRVLLFARPDALTGDAGVNYRIIARSGLSIAVHDGATVDATALRAEFVEAEWLVDALFGTGLTGALRAPFDGIVAAVNDAGKPVLAVDIPSGLDGDTGQPLGPTVRALHTVTFVAPKQGFARPAAAEWLGRVHVAAIGAPRVLLREFGLVDGPNG